MRLKTKKKVTTHSVNKISVVSTKNGDICCCREKCCYISVAVGGTRETAAQHCSKTKGRFSIFKKSKSNAC